MEKNEYLVEKAVEAKTERGMNYYKWEVVASGDNHIELCKNILDSENDIFRISVLCSDGCYYTSYVKTPFIYWSIYLQKNIYREKMQKVLNLLVWGTDESTQSKIYHDMVWTLLNCN